MPLPRDGTAGRHPKRPAETQGTNTATNGKDSLSSGGHCADCACRCRCHQSPPEPPYTPWPTTPLPGEPFYMAAVAVGEVEFGKVAA